MSQAYVPPAARLVGMKLPDGFFVIEALIPKPHATGGNFSFGYIAEKDGQKFFLKALDYSTALRSEDPPFALQLLTQAFLHERDVCFQCKSSRLTRVVLPVVAGTVEVDPSDPIGKVQYIIFEKADGDIRSAIVELEKFDIAWALRALHGIAVALQQLHGIGIAHQDVKPSNVLLFSSSFSKLSDLGRSSATSVTALHDQFGIAGDPVYAPPELLYGAAPADWNTRRVGCDSYMFGNLISFFFCGANLSSLLQQQLDPAHRAGSWSGSYAEALPYLVDGFGKVLNQLERHFPSRFRAELRGTLLELCHPDPTRRGRPTDGAVQQFSMKRYISRFDKLARQAEFLLGRSK